MMDSHSFGRTSGFQRVTKSWNSRGSKSGRSRAVSKKTRGKTSKRQTKKRLQERDDKLLLNKQDYEVMQDYYRDYREDYSRCCSDVGYSKYWHPDTDIGSRTPTRIIRLHATTFCSPMVCKSVYEWPPRKMRYRELAPTNEFQILGGGVSWLSCSVFEQDVLLVLATFVPEIGFGGFAHQTYKFPKLHEDSKAVTYAIDPVSLYTKAKEEEEKEKIKELRWKIVSRKKDNDYAPTPGKEFSWSCKFLRATRSIEDCKFLQSQGMRCLQTSYSEVRDGKWRCGDLYLGHDTWVTEMGFEDLETLFEASLIPSEVSEEQIKNLDELIGTCAPEIHRERHPSHYSPYIRIPYGVQRQFLPGATPSKRSIRVEAYAGVNKNLKVFFCMSYFIKDRNDDYQYSWLAQNQNHFEIYCFDLHEFLCVLSKVNCILEIREYGKFVYSAEMLHWPESSS